MIKEEKMFSTEEEYFETRPTRKPDKIVKGKMDIWNEEGVYGFTARKENPEMKREVLLDRPGVKLAKTAGKKESSIILTAKVNADSADPQGELIQKVVKELKSQSAKVPQIPNASFLINEEGRLKVWRRKSDKSLNVYLTLDTRSTKSHVKESLLDAVTKINKVISQIK